MTKIIAIAGRKQSGKSSLCMFSMGHAMLETGVVKGSVATDHKGRLWITDIFGTPAKGIFDPYDPRRKDAVAFAEEHIFPYHRIYSFADKLKHLCIELLGLSYEQVYGTDEQKNSPTDIRWETFPSVCVDEPIYTATSKASKWVNQNCFFHEPGFMTAREVLQYVGTQIFRKMKENAWVDACLNQIKKDAPEFAFISDCRFPSEVEAVKAAGGKVIRLTRNGDVPTTHESEFALDADRYDWSNFDAIIDNKDLTQAQSEVLLIDELKRIGWVT